MLSTYIGSWQKIFTISGRANRKEYWLFWLGNVVVNFLLLVLYGATESSVIAVLWILFDLVLFVPNLTLSVRRLHDLNRSGLWLLLTFIPIIDFILLIVMMFISGTRGDNDFGSPAK